MPTLINKPLKRRYSYSFANASRFLPIYDKLIDIYNDPSKHLAPSITINHDHFPGIAPATLVNRISDGLKWLVEKFELPADLPSELRPHHSREDYMHLKLNLKINSSGDSVVLSLRMLKTICHIKTFTDKIENIPIQEGEIPEITTSNISDDPNTPSIFRSSIEAFLADSKEIVIQCKNCHPTEGDMVWIKNLLLTTPGLSSHWQGTTLTIAKEQ